jgi:hypothetical protein
VIKYNHPHVLVFYLLIVLSCSPGWAGEYRIDSQETFDTLRSAAFRPGDIIQFKRGVEFIGMFAPSGSGTGQAPIRMNVYGEGARPVIHARGKHPARQARISVPWPTSGQGHSKQE